MDDTGVPEEHK